MSLSKDLKKYKPRKQQVECLEFIDREYKADVDNKFFLLNLPTGSGKSHLAMMIADWYIKNVDKKGKIDIITNSKILQDQYSDTYESIFDIRGMENYECEQFSCSCAEGRDFAKLSNLKCDNCPYVESRVNYVNKQISLTNFHLYTLYSVNNSKLLTEREPRVLIMDECHEFENILSDYITFDVSEHAIKRNKLENEKKILSRLKNIKETAEFSDFIDFYKDEIEEKINTEKDKIKKEKSNITRSIVASKITNTESKYVKDIKNIDRLEKIISKIQLIQSKIKEDPKNWVVEKNYSEKTKQFSLSLSPVWINEYINEYVFKKYDMVFMMSGTILDKEMFSFINGLDLNTTKYYSIDSFYEKENRPVYYFPIGKMTYNEKEHTFKKMIPVINKILKKYKNKKGIIHTNSFEFSKWVHDNIKNDRLMFHTSEDKDLVLKEFMDSKEAKVIVSPSLDTGVSFDDDKARFQVILKVPYPSLASKKNKIRMDMNQDWYAWATCSKIQQASGRIIRSEIDFGDTIILDSSFSTLMVRNRKYFNGWFYDSIIHVTPKK